MSEDQTLYVISQVQRQLLRACNLTYKKISKYGELYLVMEPSSNKKQTALVKAYVDLGGHQLQINSINREALLDAQKHPEDHKNLIVRVWGWSGYFNELDEAYQNHIISRTEFMA